MTYRSFICWEDCHCPKVQWVLKCLQARFTVTSSVTTFIWYWFVWRWTPAPSLCCCGVAMAQSLSEYLDETKLGFLESCIVEVLYLQVNFVNNQVTFKACNQLSKFEEYLRSKGIILIETLFALWELWNSSCTHKLWNENCHFIQSSRHICMDWRRLWELSTDFQAN